MDVFRQLLSLIWLYRQAFEVKPRWQTGNYFSTGHRKKTGDPEIPLILVKSISRPDIYHLLPTPHLSIFAPKFI